MTTRKAFLGSALAVAGLAGLAPREAARAADAKPSPTPAPKPTASAPPRPSALAKDLAASLQRDLPKAHLGDAMTEKIAEDIQGNFVIGKAFRNRSNRDLPPPDFVFVASEETR